MVSAVAGAVFGEEAARGEISSQPKGLLGTTGALAVQQMLESAKRPADSGPAAVFGLGLSFVAATSVFVELRDSLNCIWRLPQRPGNGGLWVLVRARLMPFGMILGVGFLLVVSLAVSATP